MIKKYIQGEWIQMKDGENLIYSAIEGANMLLEGYDKEKPQKWLNLDFGERVMREEIGRLKYHDQGMALKNCLADNPHGEWLKQYVQTTFSQYWGRDGCGSIHAHYLNKDKNPSRLRTEIECFKSAMVLANNYAKEHPESIQF